MSTDRAAWFARHADRRRPDAFINTNPGYFASECASAIAAGTLAAVPAAPPPPSDRVPADNFCRTLAANVDNDGLDDAAFREFVRNSLPIVDLDARPTGS